MLTQNHKHVVAWILLSGCLLLVRAAAQPNTTTGSYLSDETRTASFSNSAVPSAAPVAPSVLPQFAFGGGWYSALYFTNLTGSPVSFPVNFVSDAGAPLNVPVLGGSKTNAAVSPRWGGGGRRRSARTTTTSSSSCSVSPTTTTPATGRPGSSPRTTST